MATHVAYTPGLGNAPFGNLNTNPQSSQYQAVSGYNAQEQILIAKAVSKLLFDSAPEQYNALRLLYARPFEEVNLDEFEFLEYTFSRSPLTAATNAQAGVPPGTFPIGAVAAIPGTPATQTIYLTPAAMQFVTPDLIIIFPTNEKAVIRVVNVATNNIVVESQTSDGLPAVAASDIFSIQSTIMSDAMDYFSNYERLDTITRYNFIQFFLRACRWGMIEIQKHINAGTTNYLAVDKENKLKQMRVDLFNTLWNGQRGEFRISNGYIAKATGGIFPSMVAAGSQFATPAIAGIPAAFQTLAFATNFKKEGATRFIYGTDESLYILSTLFKNPIQYRPNDYIATLNLTQYEIGTMKFVPIPTELWKEQSCFPALWRKRIIVLDQESIIPVKMKGIPQMNMGSTLDRKDGDGGTRETFKDWWVQAQLGLKFYNPLGSFYIDYH